LAERVACALCGGREATPQPLLTRYSCNPEPYSVCRCDGCGLVYLSPRPTIDELSRMYAENPYYGHDNAGRGAGRLPFYRSRWRRLERLVGRPGRLLGVGCLEGGQSLQVAQQLGWQVTGVESSEVLAAHARDELGVDVRVSRAWDLSGMPDGEFDAVYSHSLEHVSDPRGMLRQARRCLKPRGVLLVEVPNQFNSLKERMKLALLRAPGLRAERWLHLDPRFGFHVYFFTPRTLRALAEDEGFEVEALRTYLPRHPVYLSRPPKSWLQELLHLVGGIAGLGPSIELTARA
jgi:SAM-dependent methyltransferase